MSKFGTSHTTNDELRFLDSIGTNAPNLRRFGATREKHKRTLLKNYLNSMPLRAYWGSIDPEVVKTHIQGLLATSLSLQ